MHNSSLDSVSTWIFLVFYPPSTGDAHLFDLIFCSLRRGLRRYRTIRPGRVAAGTRYPYVP